METTYLQEQLILYLGILHIILISYIYINVLICVNTSLYAYLCLFLQEQETALNVTQPYVRLQGRTDCLTYALNHNRSPYTHLYKRKVLIRGRDDSRKITCKDKSHMCCIKSNQIVTKDPNFEE